MTKEDREIHLRNERQMGATYWRYWDAPSEISTHLVRLAPQRRNMLAAPIDNKELDE